MRSSSCRLFSPLHLRASVSPAQPRRRGGPTGSPARRAIASSGLLTSRTAGGSRSGELLAPLLPSALRKPLCCHECPTPPFDCPRRPPPRPPGRRRPPRKLCCPCGRSAPSMVCRSNRMRSHAVGLSLTPSGSARVQLTAPQGETRKRNNGCRSAARAKKRGRACLRGSPSTDRVCFRRTRGGGCGEK